MVEKHVSERLLNEISNSLINFLWYLWDVYCDHAAEESTLLLQVSNNGQLVTIPTVNKTVEQAFDTAVDATIIIRKDGLKYYMSRK